MIVSAEDRARGRKVVLRPGYGPSALAGKALTVLDDVLKDDKLFSIVTDFTGGAIEIPAEHTEPARAVLERGTDPIARSQRFKKELEMNPKFLAAQFAKRVEQLEGAGKSTKEAIRIATKENAQGAQGAAAYHLNGLMTSDESVADDTQTGVSLLRRDIERLKPLHPTLSNEELVELSLRQHYGAADGSQPEFSLHDASAAKRFKGRVDELYASCKDWSEAIALAQREDEQAADAYRRSLTAPAYAAR